MTESKIEKIITIKENLERVLDNLKDGIIAHDIKRRIFFFNHEAERITGFSRKDVLGRDCHDVFEAPFCGERCSFSKDNPEIMDNYEYTINMLNKNGEINDSIFHLHRQLTYYELSDLILSMSRLGQEYRKFQTHLHCNLLSQQVQFQLTHI